MRACWNRDANALKLHEKQKRARFSWFQQKLYWKLFIFIHHQAPFICWLFGGLTMHKTFQNRSIIISSIIFSSIESPESVWCYFQDQSRCETNLKSLGKQVFLHWIMELWELRENLTYCVVFWSLLEFVELLYVQLIFHPFFEGEGMQVRFCFYKKRFR